MNKGACLTLHLFLPASVAAGTCHKRRTAHWLTVFYCPGISEMEVNRALGSCAKECYYLTEEYSTGQCKHS